MHNVCNRIQAANRLFCNLAGVMVGILSVVILYDVVMRYVLKRSMDWAVDFGELAMLLLVYLPSALLLQERRHVFVELIVERLSGRRRAVLDVLNSLFVLGFSALLAWQSIVTLFDVYQRGNVTMVGKLPVYPATVFFVLGALLLMLQGLMNLVQDIARIGAAEKRQKY